jgi:hypothetical protein
MRQLGVVTLSDERPERTGEEQERADRTLALLREEIERERLLRDELADERGRGGHPATARADAVSARLEGACRLALRLGLVTPDEARGIWHEAAQAGIHGFATRRGGDE